jgi:hypothetical protein
VITRENKEGDANVINSMEYKNRSYEELSAEFKHSLSRAAELVPLMYNRLTIIDKLSHKAARKKIIVDHRNSPGFSERTVQRYLPFDNKTVPRRVRPGWRKNSVSETPISGELSNTKQGNSTSEENDKHILHFRFLVSRNEWWDRFIKPLSNQKREMVRVKVELDKHTGIAAIRIE